MKKSVYALIVFITVYALRGDGSSLQIESFTSTPVPAEIGVEDGETAYRPKERESTATTPFTSTPISTPKNFENVDAASCPEDRGSTTVESLSSAPTSKGAQSQFEQKFREAQEAVTVMRSPWAQVLKKARRMPDLVTTVQQLKGRRKTHLHQAELAEFSIVRRGITDMRDACRVLNSLIQSQREATVTACVKLMKYFPYVEEALITGRVLPYLKADTMSFAQIVDEYRLSAHQEQYYPALLPAQLSQLLVDLQRKMEQSGNTGSGQVTAMKEMATKSASPPSNVALMSWADLFAAASRLMPSLDLRLYRAENYPLGVTRTGHEGHAYLEPGEAETSF